MLGPDGVLVEPHSVSFVTFLATQIADLIAYFESRHRRTTGEVNLADLEPGTATVNLNLTPPLLNWGTPGTSGAVNSSWGTSTPTSTPRAPPKPQSGVFQIMLESF